MHPDLRDLLDLQKLDSEIQEATALIESVPVDTQRIDERLRELEEQFERRRASLTEAQKERRGLEGELEVIKERHAKYQSQLMEVKSNDAYRAMLHEIEATKKEIATHEERILEKMLLADELEESLKGDEKQFREAGVELEREKARLQKRGAEAEERRSILQGHRADVTRHIDPGVLKTYERVGSARNGVAVVGARDEFCLGCRVKLRPQIFNEVRSGAELRQCDSCGRFLFFVDSAVEGSGESTKGAPESAADEPPTP